MSDEDSTIQELRIIVERQTRHIEALKELALELAVRKPYDGLVLANTKLRIEAIGLIE